MPRLRLLVAALAVACQGKIIAPTSSAVLVVRGTVTDADAAGRTAVVRARSSPASDCTGSNPHLNAQAETQSGPTGAFEFTVPSTAPGPRCVRVAAYAGQPGTSDSSVKIGLYATFKETPPPDTLTVNLDLP